MGLAVVAGRSPGVAELVEHGRNGRLVPPDDPGALAATLAALIRDPAARLRLGRAGRRRVLEQFAAEPGIDRLAARLAGMLERADRAAA
jgi:glycosyltransferase involved in cell wall biosynthesis